MHELRGLNLRVFDPNITETSPAGSCLLKMLSSISEKYHCEIFTAQTDLAAGPNITIRKMPVPMKPVFLQSILFTLLSIIWSWLSPKPAHTLTVSTQGGFPLCDISYAHCCHKLFLTRYREQIGGGLFRRTARLVNHGWGAAMERIAFAKAAAIIVPSQGLKDELIAAYGNRVTSKLTVIANPVDCSRFAAPTVARTAGFAFAFCALGNFEWKGLSLVLEALTDVDGSLTVIGGSASELAQFKDRAQSLGVSERVTFTGLQADIRPHLWRSHTFVFPSVYETFPLVCLQAAAAGLPLIATPLYGLEELLQPDMSGWRVERTVNSLRAAMQAAIENPERTHAMGQQAQTLAQQYGTERFQQLWAHLLATYKRSACRQK